jgi:Uncharacterized protein conserved in bacteria
VATFDKMLASPEFDKLRAERGLFPFARTGAAATDYVKQEVQRFKKLARARPDRAVIPQPTPQAARPPGSIRACGGRRTGVRP